VTLGKDMVFRDLAQGAFRMRGIGEGQTITLLVIPEVEELMGRQLSKAGYRKESHASGECLTVRNQRARLQEVTAWLVINSMRTERLQFDQLCHQNLASIWRANAFDQVLDGHRRFAVNASAAAGYILDMLGEAFVSNRDGHVSRSRLEGKVIALYFRERKSKSVGVVDSALRQIYELYCGGKGVGLEVVQVDNSTTMDAFQSSFREMPWLSVPFSHARRRQALRHLFEVQDDSLTVVLLNQEGQVITRDGRKFLELAHTCQLAVEKKKKKRKEIDDETQARDKEQEKLQKEQQALQPALRKIDTTRLKMAALKPSEVNEVNQFLTEPAVSEEAQQALDQAEKTLADARHKLNALSTSELEHARSTDTPSADLKRTVEAVCGMFELRADFCLAQSRLMRSAEGLRRRLVNFDPSQVPRNAPARLQLFVGGPAPSTEKEPVAAALHSWVVAMLAHDAAAMEAQMCVEEVECSPTMVAACEAVCDLYGLTNVDDDLRGALMLAAAFPDKSETTKETEAAGHSEAATSEHDVAETAQFDALQQKVYRLRQFTSLLKKDIDAAVAAVCTQHESLQTQVERLGDRHGWMTILSTSAGNGDEVLTLAITLMLGLVFPDALAKTTDGRTDVMTAASSTVAPVNRSAFDKFMNALRNIQLEITEARCELQDVATLQSLAEQLEQRYPGHRFQVGGSTPTYLCDWLIGLTKYHTSMLQLATKKTQLAEMQEELAEAVKAMKAAQDASGAACGGGYDAVSATQVKAVQEEAAKQGANAPAERARWALKRTGGNEATSAALLIAQPAARRVLLALRNPSDHLLRTEAELSTVSPQMVRRVRLSFRKDKVRQVVDECVKATNHFPSNEADGEAIGDMNASMVELLLFRWALGVCDYVEGLARTQPQQQKVMLLERKLEEKTRALTVSLTNQGRSFCWVMTSLSRAKPSSTLFTAAFSWNPLWATLAASNITILLCHISPPQQVEKSIW
jgi:hypothetical protein